MSRALLLFFAAGTVVMIFVMAISGKSLKTPSTPHGIIDLEFAYNNSQVEKVIQAWQSVQESVDRIHIAKQNTYYDFLFLLFYSPFLFLCCKALSNDKNKRFAKPGNIIAKGALVAGLLDVLENLGMLQSLNGEISNNIATFTFAASVLKWLIVLIVGLSILYALFNKCYKRN